MKRTFSLSLLILITSIFVGARNAEPETILSYEINPKKSNIQMFLKDSSGRNFRSIENLRLWLQRKGLKLKFAMNGGMYMENRMPLGLYIENGKMISALNTRSGSGNFYLKPNAVFFIKRNKVAGICETQNFKKESDIMFASQSGPMLLIAGKINSAFTQNSQNLNIRNGVGILKNGNVIFAMSKHFINFFEFADYFKSKGCVSALYLDGFVSRTYLPDQNWIQTDGNFGVIIGESIPN